jgi:hypothetical protein
MPVGTKLLDDIVKLTNITYDLGQLASGDYHLSEALKISLNEGASVDRYNEHLQAAWQLAASSQQALSIDNVIDALEDEKIELVGKLGIVRAIHIAENQSNFFKDENGRFEGIRARKFNNTWYDYLTKLLTEGVRKSEIGHIFDNIEIINFNYDRCIEQYLPYSLANYYGVDVEAVRALMPRLVMHRPYGVAGKLPWQGGDMPTVAFGGDSTDRTAVAAKQIRTFTERVEEGEALELIRAAVSDAERIIFLGFAFHRQNVELIAAKAPDNAEIVATAFQVSRSDRDVIEDELARAFEFEGMMSAERVELADLPCAKFFEEYWRTLTADPPHMPFPEGG